MGRSRATTTTRGEVRTHGRDAVDRETELAAQELDALVDAERDGVVLLDGDAAVLARDRDDVGGRQVVARELERVGLGGAAREVAHDVEVGRLDGGALEALQRRSRLLVGELGRRGVPVRGERRQGVRDGAGERVDAGSHGRLAVVQESEGKEDKRASSRISGSASRGGGNPTTTRVPPPVLSCALNGSAQVIWCTSRPASPPTWVNRVRSADGLPLIPHLLSLDPLAEMSRTEKARSCTTVSRERERGPYNREKKKGRGTD